MPEVTISTGRLNGATADGVDRYLGIPYAAAPVGEHRFALPAPHPGWKGARDATRLGPTAPQMPYRGVMGELLPTVAIEGDEYLNVNVWAPANAQDLPVMVWVHGGSFAHGSNALSGYDGTSFARDGVVFVSVNYRVGSEGFSVLPDAPLNLGVADVIAALRWVRDEIAAFGGDPARVTVCGQSAGSILLGAVITSPDATGLAARAILMSGAPGANPPAKAGAVTQLTAKRLGVSATRGGFAGTDSAALAYAADEALAGTTPITGGPGFAPVLDGPIIPRDPLAAILDGAAGDIDLLIGSTTEEYRLWFVPTGLMEKISAVLFAAARIKFRIGRRVLAPYRANRPGATRGELFGALATDILLRLPINRVADSRLGATGSTHVYEFAWPTPVLELGAAHAVELGFVFDGVGNADWQGLVGPDAPQQVADDMHRAWVNFVKSGDPGWEAWSAARPVRVFTAPTSETVHAPREDERAVWG